MVCHLHATLSDVIFWTKSKVDTKCCNFFISCSIFIFFTWVKSPWITLSGGTFVISLRCLSHSDNRYQIYTLSNPRNRDSLYMINVNFIHKIHLDPHVDLRVICGSFWRLLTTFKSKGDSAYICVDLVYIFWDLSDFCGFKRICPFCKPKP